MLPFLSVGSEVDVDNVDKVLGDMGIELSDSEVSKLVNSVPVDGRYFDQNIMHKSGLLLNCRKVYKCLSACLPNNNE